MIEWLPALERPPPLTTAQPETAGLSCWIRRYNASMRTLLLVSSVALLYSQSSQLPPRDRAEQKQTARGKQDSSQNGPRSTVPPPAPEASGVNEPPSRNETNPAREKTDQVWKKALTPETWPNWALVIVGGFAAYAAIRTLRAIKEQARIARIGLKATRVATSAATVSAKAARESADTATRAAELAEKTLHLTERADMLINAVPISTYPEFNADSVIHIVFKNFGRTRASRVEVTSQLFLVGIELAGTDAQPLPVAAAVGPGADLGVSFQPMHKWLNLETFEKICNGEIVLRFEAEAVYFDVFDKRHHTRCSGTFMPEHRAFGIDSNQEAD